MNRQRKLNLIIAHNESMKYMQDAEAEYEAQKIIDAEVVRIMQERKHEWNYGSPAEKKGRYAAIQKEVREAI